MPPTRNETDYWLLGNVASVLDEAWVSRFNQENLDDQSAIPLPFRGKPKLPTKGQTLKLLMFFKKSSRLKASSTGELANMALDEIYRYWKIANIPVVVHFHAKRKIVQLFNDYQKLAKSKSRDTETEKQNRATFVDDLEKLFELAAVDAEEKIRKDRLLEDDAKCEDILFLEDQRGPRVGWIDVEKVDLEYSESLQGKEARIAKNNELTSKEKQSFTF